MGRACCPCLQAESVLGPCRKAGCAGLSASSLYRSRVGQKQSKCTSWGRGKAPELTLPARKRLAGGRWWNALLYKAEGAAHCTVSPLLTHTQSRSLLPPTHPTCPKTIWRDSRECPEEGAAGLSEGGKEASGRAGGKQYQMMNKSPYTGNLLGPSQLKYEFSQVGSSSVALGVWLELPPRPGLFPVHTCPNHSLLLLPYLLSLQAQFLSSFWVLHDLRPSPLCVGCVCVCVCVRERERERERERNAAKMNRMKVSFHMAWG
jgi:hypothetical protein